MQKVEIPDYIRKIKVSNARVKKYYEQGKKGPASKKYQDKTKYDYVPYVVATGRKYLTELATGERVVANPKAAGTPNVVTINGQALYNGAVSKHLRARILGEIKESYMPYVNQMDIVEEYPIIIEMEIHDTIFESTSLWDVDNRSWPYIKAFQDCLTGNKNKLGVKQCKQIIPDDNILYVTSPPSPKFIPVDREEDRKIVFIIKKETDVRILKHVTYCKECKTREGEITKLITLNKDI